MVVFNSLGAINKLTGNYVYPKIANKEDSYKCPDCNKDLVFCNGQVRNPYFRHKKEVSSGCTRYTNPGESVIHKEAKNLLKLILEKQRQICFIKRCRDCRKSCIRNVFVQAHSSVQLEYGFTYGGSRRIADVACINGEHISFLVEICYTHRTCDKYRPEPWFEVDARSFIELVNSDYGDTLRIPCIRGFTCNECLNLHQTYKKKSNCDMCSGSGMWYACDDVYISCPSCSPNF